MVCTCRVFALVVVPLALLAIRPPQATAQTYRWDGTAPVCDGSCGANETEITRAAVINGAPPGYYGPPFGDACVTGTKALCQSTPGRSCRWEGTAPLCNGSCPGGWTKAQPPTGSSGGDACATGSKVYCCTSESIGTAHGAPLTVEHPPDIKPQPRWSGAPPAQRGSSPYNNNNYPETPRPCASPHGAGCNPLPE